MTKVADKKKMRERELIESIRRLDAKIARVKKKNRLAHYNRGDKVHEKQLAFHRCQKRNRWVFGGNRSGKTECGAAEAVWMARGNHPYRENRENVSGWVVSLTREVQREVAQSKLLDYLNPDWIVNVVMVSGSASNCRGGIIDYIAIRNVFGGISKIGFKSCEMGREKFQGASLDFVWFDEEPPEDIYDECRMRVLDKKGDVFGTMTPLKGMTFVHDRIYRNADNDDENWHISMEWADNPFLDQSEAERIGRTMSGAELDSRRYGRFSADKGLVYPEFDDAVHVIEPFDVPSEWQDRMSIDPGLNNPLSCHWYAVDGDGNVFVVAEHYEAGRDIGYHAEQIRRISNAIGWHTDSQGRLSALIDSAANQRTLAASKSVTELFYEQGILTDSRVDKNMFAGIARVKEYLVGAKDGAGAGLYIFSNCSNLIREIKGYWWGSGDCPKKKDDHALDELRYFIMSRPRAYVSTPAPNELKAFKEKLMRRVRKK